MTPTFPPLISGKKRGRGSGLFASAVDGARDGSLGAGDLVWADATDVLRFALVLQPDVPRLRCFEVLYAVMVAFGDTTQLTLA